MIARYEEVSSALIVVSTGIFLVLFPKAVLCAGLIGAVMRFQQRRCSEPFILSYATMFCEETTQCLWRWFSRWCVFEYTQNIYLFCPVIGNIRKILRNLKGYHSQRWDWYVMAVSYQLRRITAIWIGPCYGFAASTSSRIILIWTKPLSSIGNLSKYRFIISSINWSQLFSGILSV